MVELVARMSTGSDLSSVAGLWFRRENEIVKNELRAPIGDLDSIPCQDYDYRTHYLLSGKCVRRMDAETMRWSMRYFVEHVADCVAYATIATRGCPFGCSYCCNSTMNKLFPHQRAFRKRSVENVMGELVRTKMALPFVDVIQFVDDGFFLYSDNEIAEFAEKYKE